MIGKICPAGCDEPIELELEGDTGRDFAGHLLKFTSPEPKPSDGSGLATYQQGRAADMTESRKMKVLARSMDELIEFIAAKQPFTWHWEILSILNNTASPTGELLSSLQAVSDEAMAEFREPIRMAMTCAPAGYVDEGDDAPQSVEEAQADGEDAGMQLLLDRVTARLERGEFNIEDLE